MGGGGCKLPTHQVSHFKFLLNEKLYAFSHFFGREEAGVGGGGEANSQLTKLFSYNILV